MNNKLILPRQDDKGEYYISYSQKSLWKRSKWNYIREYFFNQDTGKHLKPYGDFGNKIADVFRNNDYSGFSEKEIKFLKSIPKYDEFEREVKLDLGGYYFKGYIDSNTKVVDGYVKELLDYKTGDIDSKKGDYESEEYDQVEMYAGALGKEFGKLPDKGVVMLIQRDGNAFQGDELKLGDKFIDIDKDISEGRVNAVIGGYKEVAEEISEYYKVFLKLSNIPSI